MRNGFGRTEVRRAGQVIYRLAHSEKEEDNNTCV